MPRFAILAAGLVLAVTLVAVAGVRLSGTSITEPVGQAVIVRSLRFDDTPQGDVAILDGKTGQQIDLVRGEAGFLRGTLRALARQRQLSGIGREPAFELIGHADGRLTLSDPATGERINLESFGPTNAAVFSRLLSLQPKP